MSRIIDLDILLFDNEIIKTRPLKVPHPELPNRRFVLLPLSELLNSALAWVEGLGIWGPTVFGAIYIVSALLFVPGSALTLAAGANYKVKLNGNKVVVKKANKKVKPLAIEMSNQKLTGVSIMIGKN